MRKRLYLAEGDDSMTSSALINSCAINGVYSVRPKLLKKKKNVIKLKRGVGRDTATA